MVASVRGPAHAAGALLLSLTQKQKNVDNLSEVSREKLIVSLHKTQQCFTSFCLLILCTKFTAVNFCSVQEER